MEENTELKQQTQPKRKRRKEKKTWENQGNEIEQIDSKQSKTSGTDSQMVSSIEKPLQSEISTALAESSTGTEVKRKKKRVASGSEVEEAGIDPETGAGTSTVKRKKRGKKKDSEGEAYLPHTILRDVAQLRDDIVEGEGLVPASNVWHTNVKSRPTGMLFVESRGAFKAVDKRRLMEASNVPSSNKKSAKDVPSPVDTGLALYSFVNKLATYCHGLLAGFALWLCVMVYRLGPPNFPLADFLVHYSLFASAVQATFYLMIVICIVSLMGSVNVGGEDSLAREALHLHSGLVASVIYAVTLLLSLSIADQDDKLALYAHNSTMGTDVQSFNIYAWRNVNVCRCVGAILAWLILAFCPHQDLLKNYLRTFRS